MNEAELIIERLLSYYNVFNTVELAIKMESKAQNISKWKTRNSVTAIKKKCRELGIYDEIFKESNINNFQNSNFQLADNTAFFDKSINKTNTNNKNDNQKKIPDEIKKELDIIFSANVKQETIYKIEDFLIKIRREMDNA